MNSVTSIEIYPKMKKLKAEFPEYRDGGLTWEEYTLIGLYESKNRYKYGRENELYELIKGMKEDN